MHCQNARYRNEGQMYFTFEIHSGVGKSWAGTDWTADPSHKLLTYFWQCNEQQNWNVFNHCFLIGRENKTVTEPTLHVLWSAVQKDIMHKWRRNRQQDFKYILVYLHNSLVIIYFRYYVVVLCLHLTLILEPPH